MNPLKHLFFVFLSENSGSDPVASIVGSCFKTVSFAEQHDTQSNVTQVGSSRVMTSLSKI